MKSIINGSMVRAIRVLRGLRQKDLANRIGRSQPLISLYETTGDLPPRDLQEAIARALETDARILFGVNQ